ncbi:hypothetical protein ACFOVU_25610 [Nocardiopsis sediminis]|uniref:DUF3040 domain-containing protein n=1 Tax=Nocardiopsis sediminis TaxID=1778267 RepID=A0ABV8FW49_9ACTN
MGSQLSPEEAAGALHEVTERRQQASGSDAHPKWTLWAIGALAIGVCVASDLRSDLGTPLLYVLAAAVLLLTFLPRWKRAGSALGYRRTPKISARARVVRPLVMLALGALFAVVLIPLRIWEVPYPATIGSVVVVATIPLWGRLLDRAARGPKA